MQKTRLREIITKAETIPECWLSHLGKGRWHAESQHGSAAPTGTKQTKENNQQQYHNAKHI